MALTRKFLKALKIDEEVIDQIIEAHSETVEGLTRYKEDAEKLPALRKELEDLKKGDGEDWKAKYEKEHADFEAHKENQSREKTRAAKEAVYRAHLSASGIDENRIDAIVKISGAEIDSLELNEDGTAKHTDQLAEKIKTEWGGLSTSKIITGVDTPKGGIGGTGKGTDLGSLSMEEYISARKKKG